jgi:hypothetical protein
LRVEIQVIAFWEYPTLLQEPQNISLEVRRFTWPWQDTIRLKVRLGASFTLKKVLQKRIKKAFLV